MSFGLEFRNVKVRDEGVQVLHDEFVQILDDELVHFKTIEVEMNVPRLGHKLA